MKASTAADDVERLHIVLHDRPPTGIAVLIAQTFKNPLRGVPLLRRTTLVLLQDPVDDAGEWIQHGPLRWMAPPIAGWYRERQHLRHRSGVDAKPTRRFTPTDPFHLNRVADLPIQFHELHPQPSAFNAESFLLLEFYSGATRPPGRFSEGFLLRRLQRHLVENYFAKIKEFSSIATRYDKTAESFTANINLAAAMIAAR